MARTRPVTKNSSSQIVAVLQGSNLSKGPKNNKDSEGYEFRSGTIKINANIGTVWPIVKDVKNYYQLSNGAVDAQIDGELVPGKMITLRLFKDKLVGKFIPPSKEKVTVVDEVNKTVAWDRTLAFGQHTHRYQELKEISDNEIESSIVLHIPGPIGLFSKLILNKCIEGAFNDLNNGIKKEAEGVSLRR